MSNKQKNSFIRKKAQAAIEFTILIAFIGMVFVVLSAVFVQLLTSSTKDKERERMENLVQYLADELVLAKGNQVGYSRSFTLPGHISGKNYTLWYRQDAVTLDIDEYEVSKLLPTYVNGSFCIVSSAEQAIRSLAVTKRSPTEIFLENCPSCGERAYTCQLAEETGNCGSVDMSECCTAYCYCC